MLTNTLDRPATVNFAWAPRAFKIAAAATFTCGVIMHTARIIVGVEAWVRQYVTPPVDIAFGVLITCAAVPGLLAWPRYSGGRAGRWGYGFAMFMLIISVPLHLRTIWTWSTDYLIPFPTWYSLIEIPMFAAMTYMVTRLKFDGE